MNPYQIVRDFEETIAAYAGSKYAVAVESCTAALFLSCVYRKVEVVTIPKYTYPSVAASIIHAGGRVAFTDKMWSGIYELYPYRIWDGALRFHRGMYQSGLHCLSFHIKKLLPIGRGGMILTDDADAATWLRKARFDGRDEVPLSQQEDIKVLGYNFYMTPAQAAKGLQLFDLIKDKEPPDLDSTKQDYPDLSRYTAFK